jgi:hypothetical protein
MKGRSVEGRLRFRSIELQMLVDQRKDEELMGLQRNSLADVPVTLGFVCGTGVTEETNKMIQEAQQNSRLIEKRKETDDVLNAMVTNQK